MASHLHVIRGASGGPLPASTWLLRGASSNARYSTRSELARLAEVQPGMGRPEASVAALIPISKSFQWWELAQDERRAVFDESSHHTKIGMDYLPAIARKLYHGRDMGESFDFLTWFEFAPEHEASFNRLLERLRSTAEWKYVEREVEVRLRRV
jgi:chlorite dismutase